MIDELVCDGYCANGCDRCYFCKIELYDWFVQFVCARGFNVLLLGVNKDD